MRGVLILKKEKGQEEGGKAIFQRPARPLAVAVKSNGW